MKKIKITAFLMAAAIAAVPFTGCRANSKEIVISGNEGYAALDNIAQNKESVELGKKITKNNTEYTLNKVINTGYVQDGYKYYFLDVTLKNTSDTDYEANPINYFYLKFNDEDGTEVLPNVRAESYANNNINGYERLSDLAAGSEFHGYIGFSIDETLPDDFLVGFFPSATDIDNKNDVIYTSISQSDISDPPEGMLK